MRCTYRAGTFVLAALFFGSLGVTGLLQAQRVTLPDVTYTASGTFATPAISGNDLFKLAGQPFKINVIGNEGTRPHAHGTGWGDYTGLRLRGLVTSGLIPQSPINISSANAFLGLAISNPAQDVFNMAAPVLVIKQRITISAKLTLPSGTMTKWLIYPFSAPVTLNPSNGTVTYAESSGSTVLAIQSGTLNAQKGVPQARP